MSSHDISSLEVAENLSERRVWGLWATTGFGLVVIVASLIIQTAAAAVLILAKGFPHFDTSSGSLNLDEVLSTIIEVTNANFGLIVTLSLHVLVMYRLLLALVLSLLLSNYERVLILKNIWV